MRIFDTNARVPAIVTAGTEDDVVAIKAVQMGAQDYLVKGGLTSSLLLRSIRYAIERARLQQALEAEWLSDDHEREYQTLTSLPVNASTSIAAQMYGSAPVSQALPEAASELLREYAEILDSTLTERTFKIENTSSQRILRLAEQLAFLRGGPRDLVDMHVSCLKEKTAARKGSSHLPSPQRTESS